MSRNFTTYPTVAPKIRVYGDTVFKFNPSSFTSKSGKSVLQNIDLQLTHPSQINQINHASGSEEYKTKEEENTEDVEIIESKEQSDVPSEAPLSPEPVPREVFVSGALMTAKTISERNKALVQSNIDKEFIKVEEEERESFYFSEKELIEENSKTNHRRRRITRSRLKTLAEINIEVPTINSRDTRYTYVKKPGLCQPCIIL